MVRLHGCLREGRACVLTVPGGTWTLRIRRNHRLTVASPMTAPGYHATRVRGQTVKASGLYPGDVQVQPLSDLREETHLGLVAWYAVHTTATEDPDKKLLPTTKWKGIK